MKKIKTATFLWALIVLMSSCETVLDLEITEEPERLVVNGVFGDTSYAFFEFSKSKFILDNNNFEMVKEVTATVTFPDGKRTNLSPIANGLYISDIPIPEMTGTYTLSASAPGLESIEAKTELPAQVAIEAVSYRETRFESIDYYELTFTFTDPANTPNFYSLGLRFVNWFYFESLDPITFEPFIDSNSFVNQVYYRANDLVFDGDDDYGVDQTFNDRLFDGRTYNLKVLVEKSLLTSYDDFGNPIPPKNVEFYCDLFSISEDYFLYQKTLNAYVFSSGDPFSQPSQVYTNIDNGFGIFGGLRRSTYVLRF